MSQFDLSFLGVAVDMAGCPNCCRHCWLGSHKTEISAKKILRKLPKHSGTGVMKTDGK